MADFKITEAKRSDSKLLISLAGASGTGKTYSALSLAAGLAEIEGGDIVVIDTEARRALHYADAFDFRHMDFAPPFPPARYEAAVDAAEKAGAAVIVIDSMSHEHEGEGGLIEMAESGGGRGPAAWAKPKAAHKRMMNRFLQSRAHLIFCLRAQDKIDMSEKDARGKVIVKDAGWQPICEKRFPYEMTLSLTLSPDAPGVVDYKLPHKVQDQHRPALMPGALISREAGVALGKWAKGEAGAWEHKSLWDTARRNAQEGTAAFRAYWSKVLTAEEKEALKPILSELQRLAVRGDDNVHPFEDGGGGDDGS